jgi:hypothetical protein
MPDRFEELAVYNGEVYRQETAVRAAGGTLIQVPSVEEVEERRHRLFDQETIDRMVGLQADFDQWQMGQLEAEARATGRVLVPVKGGVAMCTPAQAEALREVTDDDAL